MIVPRSSGGTGPGGESAAEKKNLPSGPFAAWVRLAVIPGPGLAARSLPPFWSCVVSSLPNYPRRCNCERKNPCAFRAKEISRNRRLGQGHEPGRCGVLLEELPQQSMPLSSACCPKSWQRTPSPIWMAIPRSCSSRALPTKSWTKSWGRCSWTTPWI